MPETAESEPADYVTEFARRHRISEAELRFCIEIGPREVRADLAECGILDAYPRAPTKARGKKAEIGK